MAPSAIYTDPLEDVFGFQRICISIFIFGSFYKHNVHLEPLLKPTGDLFGLYVYTHQRNPSGIFIHFYSNFWIQMDIAFKNLPNKSLGENEISRISADKIPSESRRR